MISELEELFAGMRDEDREAALSALRVFAPILKFLNQAALPYDPHKAKYDPEQWVIWQGKLVQALREVPKGKTPDDPVYWNDFSAVAEEVSATGPNKVVFSKAMAAFVNKAIGDQAPGGDGTLPVADENTLGGVRRADENRFLNSEEPGHYSDYVVPAQVLAFVSEVLKKGGLQSVLDVGNLASTLIMANGGVAALNWDVLTETPEYGFAPKLMPDGSKKLALFKLNPVQSFPLKVNSPPSYTVTVGVAKTVTLPAGLVSAGDNPVITIDADGALPTGITYDKNSQALTINAPIAGTQTVKLYGSTPDGRPVVRFAVLVKAEAKAGGSVAINAIYYAMVAGGGLQIFVDADTNGGVLSLDLSGEAYGYGNRNRIAGTNNGQGWTKQSLFPGTVPYAAVFGNVNGVNDTPPLPSILSLTAEVQEKAGYPLSPRVRVIVELPLTANGGEAQAYPTTGAPNKPPYLAKDLEETILIDEGEAVQGNLKDFIKDPENDGLTFELQALSTNDYANAEVLNANGDYIIRGVTNGKVGFIGKDSFGRYARTRIANVQVKQKVFAIKRVDYRTRAGAPNWEGYQQSFQEFRFLLEGVRPANVAPNGNAAQPVNGGYWQLTQNVQSSHSQDWIQGASGDWYNYTATTNLAVTNFTSPMVFSLDLVTQANGSPSDVKTFKIWEMTQDKVNATPNWKTIYDASSTITNVVLEAEAGSGTNETITVQDYITKQQVVAVGNFGESASRHDFAINVAQAGAYAVQIVYATAGEDPGCNIVIGSQGAQYVALPVTGGWDIFKSITTTLNFPSGQNTLSVRGVQGKYFRLDKIVVPNSQTGSNTGGEGTTPGTAGKFKNWNLGLRAFFGLCPFPDNVDANGELYGGDKVLVARSAELGANMVSPVIRGEAIEPTPGVYDWRLVDAFLLICHNTGMMFAPRLDLGRPVNDPHLADFIPDSERQRSHRNNFGTFNGRTYASFDSATMRAKHAILIKAFLARVAASPYVDTLGVMSLSNESRYEQQLPTMEANQGGSYITGLFDYSANSLAKFRSRLPGWFANVSALNQKFNTNFASFDSVTLPPAAPVENSDQNLNYYWNTPYRQYFYLHRMLSLAEWINNFHDVIKGVSINIATLAEVGSAMDGESGARGTWGLPAKVKANGFKQNSGVNDPLEFIDESSSANGLHWTGNEVFGNDINVSTDAIALQALRTFANGGSFVTYAGFTLPGVEGPNSPGWAQSLERFDQVFAKLKAGTGGYAGVTPGQPVSRVARTGAPFSISFTGAMNAGSPYNMNAHGAWNGSNPKGPVVWTEDLTTQA